MNSAAVAIHDTTDSSSSRDYHRIEQALTWLAENPHAKPSLAELAQAAGVSPFHFQRQFKRWAGVSPKQFLQHLSVTAAKARLINGASVLDASLDAGFSGPGRMHDAFVHIEAVTPGEYKRGMKGVTIRYGYYPSPFGDALLMITDRGLCALGFVCEGNRERSYHQLANRFPAARFEHSEPAIEATGAQAFGPRHTEHPLRLHLSGTQFQIQVWRALLEIPTGSLCTYQTLAERIGNPRAVRAVGSANGANPVSYLIPCHRVIRKSGALGGYYWGLGRKLAMIGREACA